MIQHLLLLFRANFAAVLCLVVPSLIASCPLIHGEETLTAITSKNQWVGVHMSVVMAGCFSPILHLLCDEVVSTLGLDILRSAEIALGGSSSTEALSDAAKRFYTEDDAPETAM